MKQTITIWLSERFDISWVWYSASLQTDEIRNRNNNKKPDR